MPISNPLDNPLFLPTALLLGTLLIGSLIALLRGARGNRKTLADNVLFRRWRVWAVISLIYSLALFCGALTTVFLVGCLIIQGLREYARLVGLPRAHTAVLLGAGLVTAPVAALSADAFHLLLPLLLIGATLQPLFLHGHGASVRHLAFAVLGWGYIAFFLSHIVLLYRYVEGGLGILLAIGLGTALSDVGAFVVGKRFGRRKLAPTISPNKTWAGVGGNLAGAYLGVLCMVYALPGDLRPILAAGLPPVIAAGALWGDLLESSIKREFKTKDAGDWLPGFGGLLDRVDSLIMVAPLTFYLLRIVG
jgi:phosphatidate cytidylyltransferase